MNQTARLSACERVVVALSTGRERRVIEEAARLAQLTRSELVAIFIEDAELLNLAAIPFTVEITTHGERRPLEPQDIEGEMKALADASRREVRELAHAMNIPWRLEVVRDARGTALIQAAGERDIVVAEETESAGSNFSSANRGDEGGLGALLVSSRKIPGDGPIIALTMPGEKGDWVVRQAAEIAHGQDRTLLILCLKCDAQGVEHYREIVRSEMGDVARVDLRALVGFDLADVANEISRSDGSLVLASPIAEIGLTRRSAGRLANLLGTPVLLLR